MKTGLCDICGIRRKRGEKWFDCLYVGHLQIANRLNRPGCGDGICGNCIGEHGICARCRSTLIAVTVERE